MKLYFGKCFIGFFATLMYFPQYNEWRVEAVQSQDKLRSLFWQRSQSDWKDVWHSESHSRCRNNLIEHLYLACKNDIYRSDNSLTKRNNPVLVERLIMPNWLSPEHAQSLLQTVRSHQPSITNECCHGGCTWEEYAEYCPFNKRRHHYSSSAKL